MANIADQAFQAFQALIDARAASTEQQFSTH